MLGIEDYGSDVESGDDDVKTTSKTTTTTTTTTSQLTAPTSSLLSKLPPPKSTFALPPPKSSSLSLPAPSSSTSTTNTANGAAPLKQKRTKKIAINLPSLPPPEDDDDGPPAKRSRIAPSAGGEGGTAGAGKSALLSMLPAPKRPVPVIAKEARVLGGGGGPGLVFRTPRSEADRRDTVGVASTDGISVDTGDDGVEVEGPVDVSGPSTSFVPPALKKGKANVSLEDEAPPKTSALAFSQRSKTSAAPSVDFFSLGSSTSPVGSTSTPSASSMSTVSSAPSSFVVSSAPTISTFRPPSPTLDDPYPAYYQLLSGAYAPYDAEYYASYAHKWKAEYDKQIRALEKSQYEAEADGAQSVDMAAEMEKARKEIKEREDRKALTTGKAGQNENGEPVMPKMNVKGAKLGAVARSRHQLTTLLTEAYLNREALEEKIAQGRRNRKEAGNKYGF